MFPATSRQKSKIFLKKYSNIFQKSYKLDFFEGSTQMFGGSLKKVDFLEKIIKLILKKLHFEKCIFFKNLILENICFFFKNHINLTFLRGPPRFGGTPQKSQVYMIFEKIILLKFSQIFL